MKRNVLLIRTYLPSGMGGPLPPADLLSLASFIRKKGGDQAAVRIIDTGLLPSPAPDAVRDILSEFKPDIVCCSSLLWEAALVHALAAAARKCARPPLFAVYGQMPALLGTDLLLDPAIDCGIVGDGEETLWELMNADGGDLSAINGIVCRKAGVPFAAPAREPLRRLDDTAIDPGTWSLLDFRAYSRDRGWNGDLAEDAYLPVVTSRGCPFGCAFCGNPATQGKTFRPRTTESVVGEIAALHRALGVREFHVFDAAFNADPARAAEICRGVIAARLPVKLAFPHGLRADRMSEDLVGLLREAGTYKVVYGIETASPRLQAATGKNLDLESTLRVIAATARAGIITGGYFMLGFPTETAEEMRRTAAYAASSELDTAAFFKVLDYDALRETYRAWRRNGPAPEGDPFSSFTYFSRDRGTDILAAPALNALLFEAQKAFYLRPRRLWRLWRKSPHPFRFPGTALGAGAALFAAYLLLAAKKGGKLGTHPN